MIMQYFLHKKRIFKLFIILTLTNCPSAGNSLESELMPCLTVTDSAKELRIITNDDELNYNCSKETGLPLPVSKQCIIESHTGEIMWKSVHLTEGIPCGNLYCEEEEFVHYIIEPDKRIVKYTNKWNRGTIGRESSLQHLCLQPNGAPLTRKCLFDRNQRRAYWASVTHLRHFKCLNLSSLTTTTTTTTLSAELNSYYNAVASKRTILNRSQNEYLNKLQILDGVRRSLSNPGHRRLPVDIYYTSEILHNVVKSVSTVDPEFTTSVMDIINKIMSSSNEVLRISSEFNSTNNLLVTFENHMDGLAEHLVSHFWCAKAASKPIKESWLKDNETGTVLYNSTGIGAFAYLSEKICVFYINPSCAGISGVAIFPRSSSTPLGKRFKLFDSPNGFVFRFIYLNETLTDILSELDLELAAYLPASLWQNLEKQIFNIATRVVIVMKIYINDNLFIESALLRNRKPLSKVIAISIPGYNGELSGSVSIIFNNSNRNPADKWKTTDGNSGCGYWNYSTWLNNGLKTIGNQNGYVVCYSSHLTQFSYLVGGPFRQSDLSTELQTQSLHRKILNIISIIGCTLSVLGLMGIWITAFTIKDWLANTSNKILLNMTAALTLQMLLLLFINTDNTSEALVKGRNTKVCVLLGGLLQYSTLVLFTWMLIVAVLQYQRYVIVIGIRRPKHYLAKAVAIAWVGSILPALLSSLINPQSYIPTPLQLATDTGICYPSGATLYFGVVLPIGLIVLINISIFIYVSYRISSAGTDNSLPKNEKEFRIQQIRLSVLLFFLLGISWFFGILAFADVSILFSYLFCFTATPQGFVLFVYFVVLDKATRYSWLQIFQTSKCCKTFAKCTNGNTTSPTFVTKTFYFNQNDKK